MKIVVPNIIELWAYTPFNELIKVGRTWRNRAYGLTHFTDSNEASCLVEINDNQCRILRKIRAGHGKSGELAEFKSEVTYDSKLRIAKEIKFDFWTLASDPNDETELDRLEASTKGKITLIKVE